MRTEVREVFVSQWIPDRVGAEAARYVLMRPRQLRPALTNIDAAEPASTAVLMIAGSMVALAGWRFVKYIRCGVAQLARNNNAIYSW